MLNMDQPLHHQESLMRHSAEQYGTTMKPLQVLQTPVCTIARHKHRWTRSATYRMSTDVQVGLIGFVYCIAMHALEVWAGLFKGLHKYLLQFGQPLPPARDALQITFSLHKKVFLHFVQVC